LDILCPGALSSARWTKVFVGKSLQNRQLSSALYTCSGPRPGSSILSWNFLTKGSTAEMSQDNFSPVMVRKRIPNRFLNLSSHPLLPLKSSFFYDHFVKIFCLLSNNWIDNWIYWITHNYSVCTLTAHYSSL
jgi:hypothetical protein